MTFPCRHHAARIIHSYPDTERPIRDLVTLDGQVIPAAIYTTKIRCACGAVWLQDLPLIRLSYHTPDWQ